MLKCYEGLCNKKWQERINSKIDHHEKRQQPRGKQDQVLICFKNKCIHICISGIKKIEVTILLGNVINYYYTILIPAAI